MRWKQMTAVNIMKVINVFLVGNINSILTSLYKMNISIKSSFFVCRYNAHPNKLLWYYTSFQFKKGPFECRYQTQRYEQGLDCIIPLPQILSLHSTPIWGYKSAQTAQYHSLLYRIRGKHFLLVYSESSDVIC